MLIKLTFLKIRDISDFLKVTAKSIQQSQGIFNQLKNMRFSIIYLLFPSIFNHIVGHNLSELHFSSKLVQSTIKTHEN